MEEEIDLRPYVLAIFRRWALVVGLALVAAIVAVSILALTPRSSHATVDLLIVPSSSQVTLDPRFVNRDAALLTNATFQRQALIGLASSAALEQRVAAELERSPIGTLNASAVLSSIQVSAEGDIIRITGRAADDATALAIVELWGRSYERLVAEIYSRDTVQGALIVEQIDAAQKRVATEQANLEAFLAQSRRAEVERQAKSLDGLLEGSVASANDLYRDYTRRSQELDLLLQDARTLRGQVDAGAVDDLGDALASLSLRARAAGGADLPVMLSLDNLAAVSGELATAEDLDALISVVAEQRDRLDAESRRVAAAISSGELPLTGVSTADRAGYERQLAALRLEAEQLRAQEQLLTMRRDVALSSLELLQRKSEEQQIAQVTPQVAVRYLSARIDGATGLSLSRFALYGAAGLFAGALAGAALALLLELLATRRAGRALPGAVTSADQAVKQPAVHR